MNTVINTQQPGLQIGSQIKPLGVAIFILGTTVLAMGGTMIYQGRSAVPAVLVAAVTVVPSPFAIAAELLGSSHSASTVFADPVMTQLHDDMVEKPTRQAAKPAFAPAKKVAEPVPQPVSLPVPNMIRAGTVFTPVSAPVAKVATPVCGDCGAIESVTPMVRTTKADGPGIGAVAGGIARAVLGNQVGNGNGRTVAIILGAIGSGYAGNAIEKNMKKKVYQVGVHMEDGLRRPLKMAQPPQVGSKVTVDGSSIRHNDSGSYRLTAPLVHRISQITSTF